MTNDMLDAVDTHSVAVDQFRWLAEGAVNDLEMALAARRAAAADHRAALEAYEAATLAAKAEAHAAVTSESPTKHRIGERTVSTAERDLYLIEYVAQHPAVVAAKAALKRAEALDGEARDAAVIAEHHVRVGRIALQSAIAQLEAVTR